MLNKLNFISNGKKEKVAKIVKTSEQMLSEKQERIKPENLRYGDIIMLKQLTTETKALRCLVLNNNNEKIRIQALNGIYSGNSFVFPYEQLKNKDYSYMFIGVLQPWWKRMFGIQTKLLY